MSHDSCPMELAYFPDRTIRPFVFGTSELSLRYTVTPNIRSVCCSILLHCVAWCPSGSTLDSWHVGPGFECYSGHLRHCVIPMSRDFHTIALGRLGLAIPLHEGSAVARTGTLPLLTIPEPGGSQRKLVSGRGLQNLEIGPCPMGFEGTKGRYCCLWWSSSL